MLTGKQVRTRTAKNRLVPLYLESSEDRWLTAAGQLLGLYRDAPGRTRGELEEELANFGMAGPTQLVYEGLAKLLEDRCEFEVAADHAPDQIRDVAFRAAAKYRTEHPGQSLDRTSVITAVATELDLTEEQVNLGMFADLKDEQRVLKFDDMTAEQLVDRYNVALAQAVLLRSTGMEVRVWNETPARCRQLFRAIKFHKLIGSIRSTDGKGYLIQLDGPLSLFASTQKYGIQLANFLPSLLHCKSFELRADVRWGVQKAVKQFVLSANDGLRSHRPDFGVYTPRELANFEENFQANVSDWTIGSDPPPIPVEGVTWVPDFELTHTPTGKIVYVEVIGFWRKVDVEGWYKRLRRGLPGQFILAVSEQYRADEDEEFSTGPEVYRFKRTPVSADVAKLAASLAKV